MENQQTIKDFLATACEDFNKKVAEPMHVKVNGNQWPKGTDFGVKAHKLRCDLGAIEFFGTLVGTDFVIANDKGLEEHCNELTTDLQALIQAVDAYQPSL